VDAFVASNVKRCWQGAALLSGGSNVRLMAELREIHFGRWEGLTREEVEAADPVLYQDWQNGADGFEFPNGEARAEYTARIQGALEALDASGPRDLVAVLDAGVIAEIARQLTGQSLSEDALGLGETVVLTRTADGWIIGAHSSDPAGLANDAAA
jgi:broad specificity phosphatase PhoE